MAFILYIIQKRSTVFYYEVRRGQPEQKEKTHLNNVSKNGLYLVTCCHNLLTVKQKSTNSLYSLKARAHFHDVTTII